MGNLVVSIRQQTKRAKTTMADGRTAARACSCARLRLPRRLRRRSETRRCGYACVVTRKTSVRMEHPLSRVPAVERRSAGSTSYVGRRTKRTCLLEQLLWSTRRTRASMAWRLRRFQACASSSHRPRMRKRSGPRPRGSDGCPSPPPSTPKPRRLPALESSLPPRRTISSGAEGIDFGPMGVCQLSFPRRRLVGDTWRARACLSDPNLSS